MAEEKKKKNLTTKQREALMLLTCGEGRTYTSIAEEVGINRKTLWSWLNEPQFASFQEELQRMNDERWALTVDAAREAALSLVKEKNQKMVEFVLKNEGYNPTQKVEADIHTDIVITITNDEEEETE